MYDMYPWNDHADSGTAEPRYAHADPAARAVQPSRTPLAGSAGPAARATHAVQVALDRRDNGGDAEAGRPATPPATLPTTGATTGRTRQ